ncbi:MAG: hypothetical protein J4G04_06180 [Nitrosopumilaceae archaeon]|nr:hypothetical protein [Nitrosopumilaceae archaeon]
MVRPFTAKWHRMSLLGTFEDEAARMEFRGTCGVSADMRNCNRMQAETAEVEDLTDLEQVGSEQKNIPR